jgi:quercetin dioxygenase-like cupin family protein
LLAFAATAYADDATKGKMGNDDAVFVNTKDLKWVDAPADLPKGAQVAVLTGDPTKGAAFAMRLKFPDGYKIPPHWHSNAEQLTIISGNFIIHMGDTMKAEPHSLDAGGYHFLPAKMHHAAEIKGETIVQINGMGPFDIHYLNPADNPNPKSAQK